MTVTSAPEPANAPDAPGDEVAPTPTPTGPPVGLELRFERGRRRGEALVLTAGALRVGTARTNEVLVREAGVGFRHAVIHVSADGDVVVEDLGARGGTFVDGVQLRGRRPLGLGERVRFGDEVELVLAEVTERDPREALAVLVAPGIAREMFEVDDLRMSAATSVQHEDALAAARDEDARSALAHDGAAFSQDLRLLLRAGLVPQAPDAFLQAYVRWSHPDPICCLSAPGEVYLLARRWELLARIPDIARGDGPGRVAGSLAWLLQGADRLTPRVVTDVGGGIWSLEYEAERPMLGRFSRMRAVGDGRTLALVATPAVVSPQVHARSAEDPIEDALTAARATQRWRPPTQGVGPAAPSLPPGGRYGRARHKPERAK